jgi:hypothetical protein
MPYDVWGVLKMPYDVWGDVRRTRKEQKIRKNGFFPI